MMKPKIYIITDINGDEQIIENIYEALDYVWKMAHMPIPLSMRSYGIQRHLYWWDIYFKIKKLINEHPHLSTYYRK